MGILARGRDLLTLPIAKEKLLSAQKNGNDLLQKKKDIKRSTKVLY